MNGHPVGGSGSPYYWSLEDEERPVEDIVAMGRVRDFMGKLIYMRPDLARSYAKLNNVPSGRAMMKQIRELMS